MIFIWKILYAEQPLCIFIKTESYCRQWFRCCKALHAFFNLWNGLKFAVLCRFYRKPLEVFFKILENSKESTCVGFSCVEDTSNRIESFIHMNFWHSNFARFPKNFYCKTFYGKNVIWNHESTNKNHEHFKDNFWFWSFFLIFLLRNFYISLNWEWNLDKWKERLRSCLSKKLKHEKMCKVDKLMIITKKKY